MVLEHLTASWCACIWRRPLSRSLLHRSNRPVPHRHHKGSWPHALKSSLTPPWSHRHRGARERALKDEGPVRVAHHRAAQPAACHQPPHHCSPSHRNPKCRHNQMHRWPCADEEHAHALAMRSVRTVGWRSTQCLFMVTASPMDRLTTPDRLSLTLHWIRGWKNMKRG
jgi:hypothetical protein